MLLAWNTEGHDMIFRAVFWIGLVSLLTPHEPDLGLGRPGAGILQSSPATIPSDARTLSRTGRDCGSACAGGPGLLSVFHLNSGRLTAGLRACSRELLPRIQAGIGGAASQQQRGYGDCEPLHRSPSKVGIPVAPEG